MLNDLERGLYASRTISLYVLQTLNLGWRFGTSKIDLTAPPPPRNFILTVLRRWIWCYFITKTCLYNADPLKPHFYIVKLGFTGVYFFLVSAQNHKLWYSLEPPRQGGSNEYPQSMLLAEIWKNIRTLIWNFSFFGRKKNQYLWIGVFS